ncbi:MAG: nicotinate-nucleotide adenylyltransferase [Candidatus Dormibacteraeota bacterium]|nr:nicotinate-nucleotide adenylyltransferase [Candidatus Dormibacteraeota bacterium]
MKSGIRSGIRSGILGGTFDPIHVGHVEAAIASLACAGLDLVYLVPAGRPPHRNQPMASGADRLAMCRLAVAGRPQLQVADWEIKRDGPSYTVDTLRQFLAEHPGEEPFLILGWDAARELRGWRDPDLVLGLARLVIVARPGLANPDPAGLRKAGIDPERTIICLMGTPNVAASEIRRRSAQSDAIGSLVPPEVESYIHEHGLYGGSPPAGIIKS